MGEKQRPIDDQLQHRRLQIETCHKEIPYRLPYTLASIYDPLGVAEPMTLSKKLMFRECFYLKLPWNQPVPNKMHKP